MIRTDYPSAGFGRQALDLCAVNRGRNAPDAKFISIQAFGYAWSILWRI